MREGSDGLLGSNIKLFDADNVEGTNTIEGLFKLLRTNL
jgi:hypothetical protein